MRIGDTFKPKNVIACLSLILMIGTNSTVLGARYGDVTITQVIMAGVESETGYLEYRFNVYNSSDEDRKVKIALPARDYGHGYRGSWELISNLQRTVVVPAKQRRFVSVFQPAIPLAGDMASITVDGRNYTRRPMPLSLKHVSSGFAMPSVRMHRGRLGSGPVRLVLVSRSLRRQGVFSPGHHGHTAVLQTVRASGQISEWSDNWLGYSRFAAVIISAEDMKKVAGGSDSGIGEALLKYVEAGGRLAVIGDWEGIGKWAGAVRRQKIGDSSGVYHDHGFGRLIVFKRIYELSGRQISNFDVEWLENAVFDGNAGKTGMSKPGSPQEIARDFPVVEQRGVPVRGLFFLMLIFAVLIGPINFFVLARKKRKIWLIWTVPAISAVFCMALFGYNLISEGFTKYSCATAVTILDQRTKRASTITLKAFYAPIQPSDGLRFSAQTAVTPYVRESHYYEGKANRRSIDWTTDQHLDSGWIVSRVSTHLRLQRPEAGENARRRVTFEPQPDGSIRVINGLGVDIRRVLFVDKNGKVHRGESVPGEESATLTRMTSASDRVYQPRRYAELMRDLMRSDWRFDRSGILAGLSRSSSVSDSDVHFMQQTLGPGRYLAVVEKSPFEETGLAGTERRDGLSFIIGITEHVSP